MGVKEKDLQTVESLSAGDKIRIVTGGGNSKNVDAGKTGGKIIIHAEGRHDPTPGTSEDITLDLTFSEIVSLVQAGFTPVVEFNNSLQTMFNAMCQAYFSAYSAINATGEVVGVSFSYTKSGVDGTDYFDVYSISVESGYTPKISKKRFQFQS